MSRRSEILRGLCLVLGLVLVSPSVWGQSGVLVDANGVVRSAARVLTPDMIAARQQATQAMLQTLPSEMGRPAPLRFVSLTRLEKQVAENGGQLTDEMRYLGGLLRIEFAFFIPETKDIVIAGPAEGWVPGVDGEMVGASSGRAICQLQDLAVALRAFSASGEPTDQVGCSIDPTQEGLAAMQQFMSGLRGGSNIAPSALADGIRQRLGYQEIRVNGISPKTHAALVLVAADFRMKLIGFNLEPSPVPMTTYLDVLQRGQIPRNSNALTRWFFTPNDDAVTISTDGNSMALTGNAVKLVDESEIVLGSGERRAVNRRTEPATRAYTNSFTKNYSNIAAKDSAYAQMANIIDMLLVAAYFQREDLYSKAEWKAEFLNDEARCPTETYTVPQRVEPIVTTVVRGPSTIAPTGGVDIDAPKLIEAALAKRSDSIGSKKLVPPTPATTTWWWQ